ncbi:MAG: homocysteine S-methyltransferase [Planctomycetes bacterium]|nr:homocysteine S-methyltransferase [Planctomycetota bacterium]
MVNAPHYTPDQLQALFARGLVVDGGLATELEKRGQDIRGELWSASVLLRKPEAIEDVHYDYLKAGADLIITASYQATFENLRARSLGDEGSRQVFQRSVDVALNARARVMKEEPDRTPVPVIAASIGPYGAMLCDGSEYHGNYGKSVAELAAFHERRMAFLASSGADILACETIPSLDEAKALVQALRKLSNACAYISFSCKDGEHVCHGETVAECAAFLDKEPQVIAVGVNCTAPRHVASLVANIRRATAKPIIVYPNSGEVWDAKVPRWTGDAEDFLQGIEQWQRAGASCIGGCCRTGPEHIRHVAKLTRA